MTSEENQNRPSPESPQAPRRSRIDLKIIALVAVVLAAFVLGLLVRGGGASVAGGHDHAVGATPDVPAQEYTCSMHPEVRNVGPGKCPICGMDLIPVTTDDGDADAGPRVLSLSPRAAALLQVQSAPVQQRPIELPLRLVGKLSADERRVFDVVVRTDSYLEKLYANYTWMPLKQGEPLAELFSPEVDAAARELVVVAAGRPRAASAEGADAALDSAVAKLTRLGVSRDQIEQVMASGNVPGTYQIRSPVDGFLSALGGHQGHWLAEGEDLAEVTDLSSLWLNLEAYETDLQWLSVGQEVQFEVQAHPGLPFTGTVSQIIPVIDNQSRTAQVRLDVPNEHGLLKPGMFTSGKIQVAPKEERPLVIPASAPLITGTRAVVYVQVAQADRPTFEGREIVLGPRAGDWFIVRDGLAEGELVVTHGNFKIDSELQVRGRISMMSPEGGAAGGHDHAAHAAPTGAAAPQKLQLPDDFSKAFGEVVQSNFELVTALADDDPQKAAAAARQTRQRLSQLDSGALGGAAQDIWKTSGQQMDQALSEVAEAKDLKAQRQHFETFSDELTRTIRTFGTGGVAPVYQATCPMVQGRKASWLQSWKNVTNPYWGEAMYTCGEISETIVEAGHER